MVDAVDKGLFSLVLIGLGFCRLVVDSLGFGVGSGCASQ